MLGRDVAELCADPGALFRDLIGDVGADAVQMRDVAGRSGVALATVYRYFSSKEHLLAAALEDWQKRLTRRIMAVEL